MPVFARIENHVVAELFNCKTSVAGLFHPALTWVEVDPALGVEPGWSWDGSNFARPAPAGVEAEPSGLQGFQARLEALGEEFAALKARPNDPAVTQISVAPSNVSAAAGISQVGSVGGGA